MSNPADDTPDEAADEAPDVTALYGLAHAEEAIEGAAPGKALSPAAKRALQEAAERRAAAGEAEEQPKEIDGRDGPEPTRYGDWERKGAISDF